MLEPALYNSRIIHAFLEYLTKHRPDLDIPALISASGIKSYELNDEGHWLTQSQVDAFNNALMAQSNNPSLSREAGRYMTTAHSLNAIRQLVLGFITPMQAYLRMPKASSYLNRAVLFKTKKISPHSVEITAEFVKGVQDKPYQCENRIGSIEAIATFFTGKLPTVQHDTCLHKGGKNCVYVVSWEEPVYLKLRRFRNYMGLLSIAGLAAGAFILSPLQIFCAAVIVSAILGGLSHYALVMEKIKLSETIEQDADTANRLLDQIAESYENSLLVQEIGRAVSDELEIGKLFEIVSETLKKRLNFDRGMIMLANSDRTELAYTTGYGYDPELENILKSTSFHLDNPNSHGAFYSAFTRQTPILVHDINAIKNDLSPRGREFAEKLGTKSFICVPIIYEGVSEGILTVDNYKSSRPLGQTGVNLLQGIATQLAISLNNAKNYHKLQLSEERFRTLSENSPDIIYTVDNQGVITYVNPSLKDHLGYCPEEIMGQPFARLVSEEDIPRISDLFQKIMDDHKTVRHFHGKLVARDGEQRVVDMSCAPNINYLGEMVGVVGVLKDVTEQAKLEEQLRHTSKMNAVGQLTGGIAHDFNNILQAIASYADLLRIKKQVANEDEKQVRNIRDLANRGSELVRQLMMFSRKSESRFFPVDLNREIVNLMELLQGTFPKNIEIYCSLEDNLKTVNGDAGQLTQIILNLAVNARDAMPDGGVLKIETTNVFIETSRKFFLTTITPGHYVLLKVSDTGIGIDKKNLEHIFEPFFTTKDVGRGTGIGLAVVYGVTKHHGGFISCKSKVGRGTEFEMYFPALDVPVSSASSEQDEPLTIENTGGEETILLVDDEDSLRETGAELLSFVGYTVVTAESGEEALDLLKKEGERFDLIIMDISMPGMGGMKCLQEILTLYPQKKVIMTSGYIEGDHKKAILESGAKAFIQKPYKAEEMNQKIRKVMASFPGT